jgi:hypothetical protein
MRGSAHEEERSNPTPTEQVTPPYAKFASLQSGGSGGIRQQQCVLLTNPSTGDRGIS